MTDKPNAGSEKAPDLAGTRVEGSPSLPLKNGHGDDFSSAYTELRLSIIRPVFENTATRLKACGYDINISETPAGKLSIHIVPPGVNKSIHPYDWFPTLSFFGAPMRNTIGLHGRNMRPNSDNGSGSRGDYAIAQVNAEMVEKALTKFIGEIGNW